MSYEHLDSLIMSGSINFVEIGITEDAMIINGLGAHSHNRYLIKTFPRNKKGLEDAVLMATSLTETLYHYIKEV